MLLISISDTRIKLNRMSKIKNKIIANTLFSLITRVIIMATGLLTTVLNAKYLTISDYANLVIAFLFISVSDVLNNIGIKEYIKSKKYSKHELIDVFSVELLKGVVLTSAMMLVVLFYQDFDNELKYCLAIISLSPLVFSLKSLKIYELNRDVNFIPLNTIEITSSIISSILMIFLLLNGFGILSFAYSYLLRNLLFTVSSQIYRPFSFRIRLNVEILKKIYKFSFWIILTNIVFLMSSRLDQMIIVNNFSAIDIASYGFAFKILDSSLIQPMKIFTSLSTPLFLDNNKRGYILPFYLFQLLLILFISIVVCTVLPHVLDYLMPGKWDQSFTYLPYLFIVGSLLSARNNGVLWYSMNTKIGFKIEIVRVLSFICSGLFVVYLIDKNLSALIYSLITSAFCTYFYWSWSVLQIDENKIPRLVLLVYPIIPIVILVFMVSNEFYII